MYVCTVCVCTHDTCLDGDLIDMTCTYVRMYLVHKSVLLPRTVHCMCECATLCC